MNIHDQVKRGMALAFFGSAYAEQAEECGQPLRGEIMDQLPDEIDPAALHAADTLEFSLCDKNVNTLQGLFIRALECDVKGADRPLTPDLFGHYLAMQAMGTGVGLESFGGAVRDAIAVPYVEFGSYGLSLDYFTPIEE